MQKKRTVHLERDLGQLIDAGSILLHTLEAHDIKRCTWNDIGLTGWRHVDAVGFACGRSHAIPPWPDQEAHEAK